MTTLGDATPIEPEAEILGPEDQSESIAEAYEEEAAMTSGPDDLESLATRIRKIEERLATIEDYLGTPPSGSGSLEERVKALKAATT